jgi:hypothetical protein
MFKKGDRPHAGPFHTLATDPLDDARPELNFLCALFRQAVADAASEDPARREDVERWLRVQGPQWWGETFGLSDGFIASLERAITQQLRPPPHGWG